MYSCSPFLTNRPMPTIFDYWKTYPFFETNEECTSVHPFWLHWRTYLCPPTLTLVKNVPSIPFLTFVKNIPVPALFDICEERAHAPTFWLLERTYLYPPFLTQVKNVIIPTLLDSSLWFLSNKFNIKKI